MERDRLRARTPEQRPEPEPVRAPAPVPVDLAGTLLGYQSTLGNEMVVRLLAARTATAGDDVGERIRARQGGGSPLPDTVRERVESGLGQPLGDVRVHT